MAEDKQQRAAQSTAEISDQTAPITSKAADDEENAKIEEKPLSEVQLLLSAVLNDRANNTVGAEQLLRRVLSMSDPQVERVFGKQTELNFIESACNAQFPDCVQCFLEVLHGTKKMLVATFGGEGTSEEGARDDASWQALEFLYIFGGFAPSTTTTKSPAAAAKERTAENGIANSAKNEGK